MFVDFGIDKSLYKEITYKKGEIVFDEGDECTKIGFIISGTISIKTLTYYNNEYEINCVSEGDFYGGLLLFSKNNIYLGSAVALKKTEVIEFSKNNFLKALENKNFLEYYLSMISNTSMKIQEKVKILSQGSIRDKILFLLYDNLKKTNKNYFFIKSKEALARYLCIPRPSLSRELITLKKEGIIIFDRKKIILLQK